MTLTLETLNLILSQIASCGTTVADVVIMAMSQTDTRDNPGGVHDVSLHIEDFLDKLHGHQLMHKKVSAWICTTMKAIYTAEIRLLTRPDAGLHYIAKGMTESKLREFNIDNIVEQMSANAPLVWELLDELLSADPQHRYKREWDRKQAQQAAAAKLRPRQGAKSHDDVNMIDGTNFDDDEPFRQFFDQTVPIVEEDEDEPEDIVDQVERRHASKITIVSRSPRHGHVQMTHESQLHVLEKGGLC